MSQVGLWHVSEGGPVKLSMTDSLWERELEEWLEHDPSLLEAGLTIVGRQMTVVGGRLDLLAIDVQNRLVVVEIKPGLLYRETLAQAIDYAAAISTMPSEQLLTRIERYLGGRIHTDQSDLQTRLEIAIGDQEARDVRICLAGTSRDIGLVRLATFLSSNYEVPITAVTFQIFDVGENQRVLLRELTETDIEPAHVAERSGRTLDDVCKQADTSGVGPPFRLILETLTKHGMYPRLHKFSIMYAPSENRSRSLVNVPTYPDKAGKLKVWIAHEAFTEFFPVSIDEVHSFLGDDDWVSLTSEGIEQLAQSFESMFNHIEAARA